MVSKTVSASRSLYDQWPKSVRKRRCSLHGNGLYYEGLHFKTALSRCKHVNKILCSELWLSLRDISGHAFSNCFPKLLKSQFPELVLTTWQDLKKLSLTNVVTCFRIYLRNHSRLFRFWKVRKKVMHCYAPSLMCLPAETWKTTMPLSRKQ